MLLHHKQLDIDGYDLFKKSSLFGNTSRGLMCYSKSISYAPPDYEELALGYGNRSALFLHLGKYNNCIIDMDRALILISNHCLTANLLCRKSECSSAMGWSKTIDIVEEL